MIMAQADAFGEVSSHPRTIWLLRFATELHKRRPQISGVEAMSIATQEFEREHNLQPERAAQLYETPPP